MRKLKGNFNFNRLYRPLKIRQTPCGMCHGDMFYVDQYKATCVNLLCKSFGNKVFVNAEEIIGCIYYDRYKKDGKVYEKTIVVQI